MAVEEKTSDPEVDSKESEPSTDPESNPDPDPNPEPEDNPEEEPKSHGLSAAELETAVNLYNTLNTDSPASRNVVKNLANNLGMSLEKEVEKKGDVDEINVAKLVEKHIPERYSSLRPMFQNLMEAFKEQFVDNRFDNQAAQQYRSLADSAYEEMSEADTNFSKHQQAMTDLAKKFPPAVDTLKTKADYKTYFGILYREVSGSDSENVNGRVGKAMAKIVNNSKKAGLRPSDGREGKSGSARPTLQQALDAAAKGVKL